MYHYRRLRLTVALVAQLSIVHWTGKDISTDRNNLSDSQRRDYVARARSILQDGFWMTRPKEQLIGSIPTLDDSFGACEYVIDQTCFTEVRLSEAGLHSQLYGLLGIGVERKFVLDRRGGPVHYVRNAPRETVVGNSLNLLSYLQKTGAKDEAELVRRNIGFLKPMSNPGRDDYAYLDEHEWRILHTPKEEGQGLIAATGLDTPVYRIPVQPGDVRLVVFPDADTRCAANDDEQIVRFFQAVKRKMPIFLTVEECRDF
jgi:hypothetical protein